MRADGRRAKGLTAIEQAIPSDQKYDPTDPLA